MAETITHAFVSAKSDSADTTLVSASEWNDGHIFNGGANGQTLVYDNTQPNNMRWVDGPSVFSNFVTISSIAAPVTLTLGTIVFTTRNVVTISSSASMVQTTLSNGTIEIKDNGVTVGNYLFITPGTTVTFSYTFSYIAAAGSHAYTAVLSLFTSPTQTLTNPSIAVNILSHGII